MDSSHLKTGGIDSSCTVLWRCHLEICWHNHLRAQTRCTDHWKEERGTLLMSFLLFGHGLVCRILLFHRFYYSSVHRALLISLEMLPQGPVLVPHCHPSLTQAHWDWGGKGREGGSRIIKLFWEMDSGSVVLHIQERSVHTTKWSITSWACPAISEMVVLMVAAEPPMWLWHSW